MNEENNTNTIDNTDNIENSNEYNVSNEIENTSTFTEQQENVITIENIHNDLGIITSFLIFFVLVILLKYAYKFFNMFFVI